MTAQTELLEAERTLYDAMKRKDVPALEGMLHPDLIFVHSTALVEDRTTYLNSVAANHYQYASIDPKPGTINVYDGFAVMSGHLEMNKAQQLLVTLVWKRQADRWLLLLRNATKIPASAA